MEREKCETERRCEKAAKRDIYVIYAARARAAGHPEISPRDYYCGCGWPDPATWLPQCACREGAENSPLSLNISASTENPVSPLAEHA